jgi:GrpB-like predicted nucleotidyltransferase (UPF0157 family)
LRDEVLRLFTAEKSIYTAVVEERLAKWLTALGVRPGEYDDPFEVWRRLRAAHGNRASVIDLYVLVADRRGLAAHELPLAERQELASQALPVMFPGFEIAETTASTRGDPIEVVSYDEQWPIRFEAWRRRLVEALGPVAKRIDHIGSTAVRGLPGKPTVDIQVSVEDVDDEAAYVSEIEALGIQLRSRDDEHRYFRPFPGRPRDVHVHVCPAGSEWERRHLLFRDYLRASPTAREGYAKAKTEAAQRWHDDRVAYTEAKGGQILDILTDAERWAQQTGWRKGR